MAIRMPMDQNDHHQLDEREALLLLPDPLHQRLEHACSLRLVGEPSTTRNMVYRPKGSGLLSRSHQRGGRWASGRAARLGRLGFFFGPKGDFLAGSWPGGASRRTIVDRGG